MHYIRRYRKGLFSPYANAYVTVLESRAPQFPKRASIEKLLFPRVDGLYAEFISKSVPSSLSPALGIYALAPGIYRIWHLSPIADVH